MVIIRTKNGKKYPINDGRKNERTISKKELEDLKKAGIVNPGSLIDVGYGINEPYNEQTKALTKALKKYGYDETLRKLQNLYRLDYHKPQLRSKIEKSIDFVRGMK